MRRGDGRPAGIRAAETLGVGVAAVLVAAAGARMTRAADPPVLWAALAGVPLGWALADLVSGVVHWLCDRKIPVQARLVGPLLVSGFLEHHRDPRGITRHSFSEVNGYNCLAVSPLLAALCGAGAPASVAAGALHGTLLALAFGLAATNQIHRWAHARRVPHLVARLQRAGLILAPRHHAAHHRAPFGQRYCITVGWLDALLDRAVRG